MNPHFGLAQRLLWLGVITTALVLSVSGFALRDRLHNAILRSLATSLNERADRVSASMRLGDSGHIFQDAGLVPDEFRTIFSGWYWQLEAGNNNKHSRSLWDSSRPRAQAATYSDDPELYRLTGPTGEALLGIRRPLDIGGQTTTLHLFGPADTTLDELKRIDRVLLISLGILALTLLVSLWLQVRLGLRPLRRLHRALRDVQNGDASRVGSGYSPDLDPLAAEMDEVLERNARIVERARGHAADLSHALKKPLALLTAESGSGQVDGEKIRNQTDTMLRLIERHLARAGSGAGDVRRIDTAACVKNLLTLMRQLHGARNLTWHMDVRGDTHIRAEQTDIEEVLGNILDNAGKWAKNRINIHIQHHGAEKGRGSVEIRVDDDGCGLSDEDMARATRRGSRFDEGTAGSGLGLAIAADITDTYGGSLELARSPLGGLQITLHLPC